MTERNCYLHKCPGARMSSLSMDTVYLFERAYLKNSRLSNQTSGVPVLASPLIRDVTLGKLFNLSVPQFSHLCNGYDFSACLTGWL